MIGFYYGTNIPGEEAQEGIYFVNKDNKYSIYIKEKETVNKYGEINEDLSPLWNQLQNHIHTAEIDTIEIESQNEKVVTGFKDHEKEKVITELDPIEVKGVQSVSEGRAASWGATVDANGVLSFNWTSNTPTQIIPTDPLSLAASSPKAFEDVIKELGEIQKTDCLTRADIKQQPKITISKSLMEEVEN